jgi:CBS domain-containing protein
MRISDVLRGKGGQVVTVTPDTDVRHLLTVLAEHRIGAVVVSHDGTSVDGIASERDIVRALAQRGATVMSEAITAIYTAEVHTVTPETPVEEVMRIMTQHRIRHAPVVVGRRLARDREHRRRGEEPYRRTRNRASAFDQLHHRYPLTRRLSLQTRLPRLTAHIQVYSRAGHRT